MIHNHHQVPVFRVPGGVCGHFPHSGGGCRPAQPGEMSGQLKECFRLQGGQESARADSKTGVNTISRQNHK